jgi:hypothetical protein
MAAHDQMKAITSTISAASIELAGLERVMRKSMAPTPYELDEVAYWPLPVITMVALATSNNIAIDYATAQRMLNRMWLERAQTYGADMAVFNLEPQQLVRFAEQQRDAFHRQAELGERGGDHDKARARYAGDPLGGDHQREQHGHLLPGGERDIVGLRDEQRGKARVHHRAIEIERIAQRQHEARNAARHAEAVKLFEQLGQRGFRRRGRESDHQRLADIADQRPDAPPQEHRACAEQDHPQQQQR